MTMARYTKPVDIWQLDDAQRAQLQPGQWVYAGDPSSMGRFFGHGATTVVAWLGNARRDYRAYMAALSSYGASIRKAAR